MNSLAPTPALVPDDALQQAGLQSNLYEVQGCQLRLLTTATLLRLHSLQPLAELNLALKEVGLSLPMQVNQAVGREPAALCLAPADWLLFSESPVNRQQHENLAAAMDPRLTSLIDQSAAYAMFRLSGSTVPWLLSKCAGLDWRKAMAGGQYCTRTLFERIPVILHYHQPDSTSSPFLFDVLLERSLARHTWQMLLDKLPHAIELEQRHGSF